MNKIIYSITVSTVCKIILDADILGEISRAKKFANQSEWKMNIFVPIIDCVDLYTSVKDAKKEWDFNAIIRNSGKHSKIDICYNWYEGPESLIDYKDLKDLPDIYVSEKLLGYFGLGSDFANIKDFYKLALKEDIKYIKKILTLRKLGGVDQDEGE